MDNSVLSIQSQVSTGYVGNNVAGFAIQLHGLNVITIPTVILSGHTDNKVYYGEEVKSTLFKDLLLGVASIPIYDKIACIVSGYSNTVELIRMTANFIQQWKRGKKEGMYVYDPVFGDFRTNGLYIKEEVAKKSIGELLPICDVLTPNHFELEYILQEKFKTIDDLLIKVANHSVLSKKKIIVTSVHLVDTAADEIETLYINGAYFYRFVTKKIPVDVVGTGDLFAAVIAAQLCLSQPILSAIEIAVSFISEVLFQVITRGLKEMDTKAILDSYSAFLSELIDPKHNMQTGYNFNWTR